MTPAKKISESAQEEVFSVLQESQTGVQEGEIVIRNGFKKKEKPAFVSARIGLR